MALSFLFRWIGGRPVDASKTNSEEPNASEAEKQFLRGIRFASDNGQDYAQAAQWYTQAAEQNHSLAQFNLALMYEQGQGVARDEAKSMMWMTRAAKLGDAAAQYKLGVWQQMASRRGKHEETAEERIEALKWGRLAAVQGYRGADSACDFVALRMTRGEVAEGERRASAFIANQNIDTPQAEPKV